MDLRQKLLPLAKSFFKNNSDLKQIFITEDNHAWYTDIEAKRFCKGVKKYEGFTPEDLKPKKPVKKTSPKKED